MPTLISEILHTIVARPYVFAFLIAYLVLSISSWGWRRSAIFLVSGYLIAWLSEASSIRTGFPYGWYFYLTENLRGEWLNWGVPVWDSLSYVFLCYAGVELARFVLSFDRSTVRSFDRSPNQSEWPCESMRVRTYDRTKIAFLAALFVVILDVIIDPLANLGERWFLGKIYYYPEPGFYFGVPVANFVGWFFVSFAIVGVNLTIPPLCKGRSGGVDSKQRRGILGPFFYFSIFLFNWIITLALGEWLLALLDLFWIFIPSFLFVRRFVVQRRGALSAEKGFAEE